MFRNVLERRRELALLRAVGYDRRHVRLMILAETIFLLLAGLVAGVVCALIAVIPRGSLTAGGGPGARPDPSRRGDCGRRCDLGRSRDTGCRQRTAARRASGGVDNRLSLIADPESLLSLLLIAKSLIRNPKSPRAPNPEPPDS